MSGMIALETLPPAASWNSCCHVTPSPRIKRLRKRRPFFVDAICEMMTEKATEMLGRKRPSVLERVITFTGHEIYFPDKLL